MKNHWAESLGLSEMTRSRSQAEMSLRSVQIRSGQVASSSTPLRQFPGRGRTPTSRQ
jgi:hypothetical protein